MGNVCPSVSLDDILSTPKAVEAKDVKMVQYRSKNICSNVTVQLRMNSVTTVKDDVFTQRLIIIFTGQ